MGIPTLCGSSCLRGDDWGVGPAAVNTGRDPLRNFVQFQQRDYSRHHNHKENMAWLAGERLLDLRAT